MRPEQPQPLAVVDVRSVAWELVFFIISMF
eukprot:COSAG01_NODE_43608_length_428_cov_0.647416_2_plen_29_part_01